MIEPTVRMAGCRRATRDRELAEVDALGVDAPVTQRLDEQPDRAAGVERRLRVEVLDQPVGDRAEEIPASAGCARR